MPRARNTPGHGILPRGHGHLCGTKIVGVFVSLISGSLMVFRAFLTPRPRCTAATAQGVSEARLAHLMANSTALDALVGALGLTTKQPEITKNALRICPLHLTPEKRARENARGASPVTAEINPTPRLRRRNRSRGPPQTEESALIG